MIYLDIILKSLGIAALITFMIIFIWGFVIFNSVCGQLKYANYILEKISHILNISLIDSQDKKHRKTIGHGGKHTDTLSNLTEEPIPDSEESITEDTVSNEENENEETENM